jgi:hypothetical protein
MFFYKGVPVSISQDSVIKQHGETISAKVIQQLEKERKENKKLKKENKKLKKFAGRCDKCTLVKYQSDIIEQMLIDNAVDERLRIVCENTSDARFGSIHGASLELGKKLAALFPDDKQLEAIVSQIQHDSNQEEWDVRVSED